MAYKFPDGLQPLSNWLTQNGVEAGEIKSERQAAFFAQQLAGTRFKFPAKGASCLALLQQIQEVLPEQATGSIPDGDASPRSKKGRSASSSGTHSAGASLDLTGLVIFADGGCEPNPGPGGWAFVVYRDGVEIHAGYGGEREATNNTMELSAALNALRWFAGLGVDEPVRLLCDSQYVVKGCNEWRHGWKKKGWKRGPSAPLANVELWQALDEALALVPITLEWVKGHAGTTGNERADEMAEIGRQGVLAARKRA